MAFYKENPNSMHYNTHGTIPKSYWMRVLEERYQRLHAKVINGTTRFSTSKSLNYVAKRPLPRCWKDYRHVSNRKDEDVMVMRNGKELKQINKCEKANNEECNPTECSIILGSEFPAKTTPKRRLKSVSTMKQENSCANINQGPTDDNGKRIHKASTPCNVQLIKHDGLENSGEASDELSAVPNLDLVEDCLSVNSYSQSSFHVSLKATDHLSNHSESGKCNANSVKNYNGKDKEVNPGDEEDNNACNREELESHKNIPHTGSKRSRRRRSIQKEINTWAHSGAPKTTTGFPENRSQSENCIKSKHARNVNKNKGRRTVENINTYGTVQQLKSRGMNEYRTRLFARMSVEAQRAVDETLKDTMGYGVNKKLQDEHTNKRNGAPVHKHSSHVRVENSRHPANSTTNISNQTGDPTPSDVVEKASAGSMPQRNTVTQEDLSNNCNSFQYSTNSFGQKKAPMQNHFLTDQDHAIVKVTQANEVSNHHLPLLEQKIAPPTHIMASTNVNLPDIKTTKDGLTFREKTFEITPLNFDIRFHQIIPRQREDRETPSPDTRQQAIEKCHQWLVRYMSIN